MKAWETGLIINNRQYTFNELLSFSTAMVSSINARSWEKDVFRFINDWLSETDHIVQYSSGTTGKSKEIKLKKQSMIDSAVVTCKFFRLQKGQTALLCLPVEY